MSSKTIISEQGPFIIGEIAQNHDGSLGMCHAYIDALADVGVHAIKFQTHIAAEESTLDEPFRVKFSLQDDSRYEYWRRMEFTETQWRGLKQHADEKGIQFMSTPFSTMAVEMLARLGVRCWKVGSGDTLSHELLDSMIATGLPIIVSTGMSSWREIDDVVNKLESSGTEYSLLQCTSRYPTPLEDVGLNILDEMKSRYNGRIGLSDHSGTLVPAMVAIARGFNLIEVHATFDRRMFGPDIIASVTVDELGKLVQFTESVVDLDSNPVDKDWMSEKLKGQKELFGKSVTLKADLMVGHVIREEDIVPKKPGSGIPWVDRDKVKGRRLIRDVTKNRLLTWDDME
ncbi:N-acetylneuraminate synthase family protein [Solemya velum gill symbiont]|uniref:Sialic acid synthase n=1 Tax=Solemya velum gill symbiont TaxID=2340 RepID=A0A0B0H9S6_SOVGS|nr:N-acetylneuraminate synthase family protein [Solemya velum gill symbiont]KHF25377.1 sialic acid synthase [Solemya velum gill symbiont]OOZ15766.1 N-acetylneuraminate synthase [Solemya velum gill symbiont]OOZ18428.1 N-acetylneuraminate synthase [Solemya velum gill symbiont]OOZ20870.1 N-acetylneuraminate synthase [Solemya velum gill symbiont]OOZ23709.1 N-acetylneuraminate synthase [Solemya velum gill symbiont]